jgi:hypothetical protein
MHYASPIFPARFDTSDDKFFSRAGFRGWLTLIVPLISIFVLNQTI